MMTRLQRQARFNRQNKYLSVSRRPLKMLTRHQENPPLKYNSIFPYLVREKIHYQAIVNTFYDLVLRANNDSDSLAFAFKVYDSSFFRINFVVIINPMVIPTVHYLDWKVPSQRMLVHHTVVD